MDPTELESAREGKMIQEAVSGCDPALGAPAPAVFSRSSSIDSCRPRDGIPIFRPVRQARLWESQTDCQLRLVNVFRPSGSIPSSLASPSRGQEI
jgi:hypothetical protein